MIRCWKCRIRTECYQVPPQAESLNAIVVPVSGGGMLSGVATVMKALRPDITIVAAEPTGSNARRWTPASGIANTGVGHIGICTAAITGMFTTDHVTELQAATMRLMWPGVSQRGSC
jgi:cysteine synthase